MTAYLTPLGPDNLRPLDISEPWTFGIADRVRFYELDALGHVNHATYLKWFETVRVSWFGDYGLSRYGPEDPTFVLKRVECDYIAPMFLHDSYIVTARASSFRTSSFTKEYGVWRAGALVAKGACIVVMTDKSGTQKVPLTAAMRDVLSTRDGAGPAG